MSPLAVTSRPREKDTWRLVSGTRVSGSRVNHIHQGFTNINVVCCCIIREDTGGGFPHDVVKEAKIQRAGHSTSQLRDRQATRPQSLRRPFTTESVLTSG